jgi:SAM-dependent methyltransferase
MAIKRLNTPEDVNALFGAVAYSAALNAAIETGLLWMLAENALSADAVAEALKMPVRRCGYWLHCLEAVGILDETAQGYLPSPLARAAILERYSRESWQHLAVDERERVAGVGQLAPYLSTAGSIWTAQGLERPAGYVEKMRQDPARAREFTRMLFEVHQRMASEIDGVLDLSGARRVLDLGGGSGVVSMALLRRYPEMTATVIDIENVCAAGREISAEQGFSDRLEFITADLLGGRFPTGYDVALQCDVGVYDDRLYAGAFAALKPGGCMVIADQFSPTEAKVHHARLEWTFLESLGDPESGIPTVAQARAMLARAGFHPLPGESAVFYERLVIRARKPAGNGAPGYGMSGFGASGDGRSYPWKLAAL